MDSNRLTALREWELRELQSLYAAVDRLLKDLTDLVPYLEAADEDDADV